MILKALAAQCQYRGTRQYFHAGVGRGVGLIALLQGHPFGLCALKRKDSVEDSVQGTVT